MKAWYSFANQDGKNGKPAELTIYDEIGFWGVTAQSFKEQLKGVTTNDLKVSINSIGGDVFAGLGIFNELNSFKDGGKKTVSVTVMGLAASISSIIAMAGDTIEMPANTFMMVHNPWTYAMGNADELRDQADVLDKIGASLTAVYVNRTGKTEDEVKALLQAETYMTAAEAVEHGFADSVTDEIKASAKFDVSDLPQNVKAIFLAQTKPPINNAAPAPPAPKTEPEPFGAAVIEARLKASGLEAFAAEFALDEKITSAETLETAVKAAIEIKALCVLAKHTDRADGFIKARNTLGEVRAALLKVRADEDQSQPTNSQRRLDPQPQAKKDEPAKTTSQAEAMAKYNAPASKKGNAK